MARGEFMKVLIGLLALGSLTASAGVTGLPSQDPVVKMLREKFKVSTQPTIEELKLGKSWHCKEFAAYKDSFRVIESKNTFKLATFDGLITSTGTARSNNMAFDGNALAGVRTSDRGLFFIRVSSDGDLVVENTAVKGILNTSNGVSAISDSSLNVFSYLVCPKRKIQKFQLDN